MQKPEYNSPFFFTQQLLLIGTYNEDEKENFAPGLRINTQKRD